MTNYEQRDVSPRAITWFGFGLALSIVLVFFGISAFQELLTHEHPASERASRIGSIERRAPSPRLQTTPATDLLNLRATEDAALGSYSWIDRDKGVLRIPIERALELTAERGLPSRNSTSAPNAP